MSDGQNPEEEARQNLIKLSKKMADLIGYTDPDENIQKARKAELLMIRERIKEAKQAGALTPEEASGIYYGEPSGLFKRLRERYNKKSK